MLVVPRSWGGRRTPPQARPAGGRHLRAATRWWRATRSARHITENHLVQRGLTWEGFSWAFTKLHATSAGTQRDPVGSDQRQGLEARNKKRGDRSRGPPSFINRPSGS